MTTVEPQADRPTGGAGTGSPSGTPRRNSRKSPHGRAEPSSPALAVTIGSAGFLWEAARVRAVRAQVDVAAAVVSVLPSATVQVIMAGVAEQRVVAVAP